MKKISLLALFTIAFAGTSCEAEKIPETLSVPQNETPVLTGRVGTGTIRP